MKEPYPHEFEFCLLIPCYNNESGLLASLKSIVYDPAKFCVVIVDDGSAQPVTEEIIRNTVSPSYPITIIRNERNLGITRALNNGLCHIYANVSTEFIARLDCGDTCAPGRFTRQVEFLNDNPRINLVGSWCYFMDPQAGTGYKYKTPTRHPAILRSMYFRNVFIHPTVMWRQDPAKPVQYPDVYPHAEDYGMFYEIISGSASGIIDEYLVSCEIAPSGLSLANRKAQLQSRLKVISHYSRNKLLWALGAVKLVVLLATPYRFVLSTKKLLFRA